MLYQDFHGEKLSALGLGCMRLPTLEGNDAAIDQPALEEMVDYALAQGVNYFDTAYMYHGGNSEAAIGKALGRHERESFYLATKFPGFDPANFEKKEEIFEEQLRRCGVEYFDFYLCHNVSEKSAENFMDGQLGLLPYLLEQKRQGRIRHLGFSTHGSLSLIERFLDHCGGEMEFCQIQLNWLDWTFQNAREKVALLNRRGLPVWVMEPLRGGKLASLSEERTAKLAALRAESVPAWGFRFLQSLPGVGMVLSGMSNMEQLAENIRTFETFAPLERAETEALLAIAEEMGRSLELPCTACRYCVEGCPSGLEIPALLKLYNENCLSGAPISAEARAAVPEDRGPGGCVACRRCESVCPQQIRISAVMADFAERLQES
ncbi:MAG: aldo/keto reductase [Oscillospiraceae bacterium]